MRRIVILISLLALGAATPTTLPRPANPLSAGPIASAFPDCRTLHVTSTDLKAIFRRLGDLPPADAYHAVLRSGPDGCSNPLLVSERIGWTRPKPTK